MSGTARISTPALSRREHRRLAAALVRAAATRRRVPLLTTTYPELNDADAFGIQALVLDERLAAGEQLTAVAAPEDGDLHPAFLTAGMVQHGAEVTRGRPCRGLGFPGGLPTDVATPDELLALAGSACLGEMVLRSRFGVTPTALDQIADNYGADLLYVPVGVRGSVRLSGSLGDRRRALEGLLGDDACSHVVPRLFALAARISDAGHELDAGGRLVLADLGEAA